MTPLHHQLGLLGAVFCAITLAIFCAEAIRQVRFNRQEKRRELARKFDGIGRLAK